MARKTVRTFGNGTGVDRFRRANRDIGGQTVIYAVGGEEFVLDLIRDVRGHYTRLTVEAGARFFSESVRLRELMVKELNESLVRTGASSGKLAAALMDERNTVQGKSGAGNIGFGVGVPEWLDRSQARYWRQIEEGTRIHIGQEIFGVWGVGPDAAGEGRNPGGPYSAFGARSSAGNLAPGRDIGGRRFNGVIDNPIVAHHYMREAWKKYRKNNLPALKKGLVRQQ